MTSRSDAERLRRANAKVVERARRDLTRAFAQLDLTNPEAARDALLEIVPALVRKYGDIAATVAADWYEEVRAQQVDGAFNAQLADTFNENDIAETTRREAGHLWSEDQLATLTALSGSIQRFVSYSSRATVARNADHDPARPRFARLPSGRKTCAFCSMLASRGFVYYSEYTAMFDGQGDKFHDDCKCAVVPEWDKDEHHIAGYDPDAMYDQYLHARASANSSDPKKILAEMRRIYPEDFTDGVIEAAL